MSAVVLDASALLALLKDEPGGRRVAEAIAASRMSVVNYAEVVSHFIQAGMAPLEIDAMLRPLPMTLVPADTDTAILERVAKSGNRFSHETRSKLLKIEHDSTIKRFRLIASCSSWSTAWGHRAGGFIAWRSLLSCLGSSRGAARLDRRPTVANRF